MSKPATFLFLIISSIAVLSSYADEETHPHLYSSPEEKRDIQGIVLSDVLSVGALIEVEAYFGEENGENVSDIVLATFELGLEADLNEIIHANALLLWEEDDTEPIDLDEATITIGGRENQPYFIQAGKMYLPFGAFNSHFISDPLTLELAETRESSVLLGFQNDLLRLNACLFQGDLNDDEQLSDFSASATIYANKNIRLGMNWISNIGESEVLQESLSTETPIEDIGGGGAFVSFSGKGIVAEIEYITALDEYAQGTLLETTAAPAAWNIEAGMHLDSIHAEVALKYEGSDEFPEFPEQQYGIAASMKVRESTSLALEYLHGQYNDDTEDRNIVTAQLATEF